MMNRKILISGLSILSALSLLGAATFAYFSDTAASQNNDFQTGTMEISVDQSMQVINPVISNWAPGGTTTLRFDVVNSGSLPVNLRAYALGDWLSYGEGDENLVKVTMVEYYDGSSWVPIMTNSSGINGYVFYSPTGTDSSLMELAGGSTEEFRLTVLFDSTAGNEYQGKTYRATVNVEAKQVLPAATWPI